MAANTAFILAGILSSAGVFAAVQVNVDGGVKYQTMDGFGSSERVFDDPHLFKNYDAASGRAATVLTKAQQDEVLDRLYRDLKLTRVRAVCPDKDGGVEKANDNDDPNVTDATKFNFAWKNLDAHVDYMARARERGATTFYLSPLSREAWMGTSLKGNDAAEYGEWLMAQVQRAADRGVRLPYLSVANEPSYSRNAMSGEFVRDVIKNVGPRLRAAKLPTMLVVPDDVRASTAAAVTRTVLADPEARKYVGALATHLYDESVTHVGEMAALAREHGLALWMTEFSLTGMPSAELPAEPLGWASLMHRLIAEYDVSAVDYMWGYFGKWEGNKSMLIRLNNTGAAYDGYTLTKTYYMTGQFSRFVRPGARRIKAASDSDSVQTTAYLNDDSQLVIVAINTGDKDQTVTFNLAGLPASDQLHATRTSASEDGAALPPQKVAGERFDAVLPHRSVTTFSAPAPDHVPPKDK